MNKKFNFTDKLDFTEIDLTAPHIVVKEILDQLPENTQGIIFGNIDEYDGEVVSYTTTKTSLAAVFSNMTTETHVDIQESLGEQGEEIKKYQCYLYTSGYTKFKYRIFFMQYGIANYPVQFTLEESIARGIQDGNSGYIFTCQKREEVEGLIFKILTSKKVLSVMQELIRIHQAHKSEKIIKDEFNEN